MSKNFFKGFRNKKQQVKTAEGRKISSIKWLNRNLNDPYINLAKINGYRSRAAYKLKDIIVKYPVLKKATVIIDLGCAPGGWLQVLTQEFNQALIIGVDLKAVEYCQGTQIICGNFLEESTLACISKILNNKKVNLILSDMAANSSGNKEIDHFRNVELIEAGIEFALLHLEKEGNFIAKFLRGVEEHKLLIRLKKYFKIVKFFKPPSSYVDSTEVFIIALNFRYLAN